MKTISHSLKAHLNYTTLVKQRQFLHAIASLPQNQWTTTSKQRWMCAKLGLYQPLLQAGLNGKHKYSLQSTTAYIEALSAYGQLEACQCLLKKWIKYPFFSRFQNELINEFAKYNPQLALQLIERIPVKKQSVYQQALRLSFRQTLGLFDKQIDSPFNKQDTQTLQELCQQYQNSHPDLLLLKNNCQNTLANEDRLQLLNHYQRYFNLPNYQLIEPSNTFDSRNLALNSALPHHQLSINDDHQYKVTILVTMYNSVDYIQSTLHSLLAQTWQNIEVIVIDDVSTDNSVQLAKDIAKQDSRLHVICQTENTGTFIAKSQGLKHATGNFVVCHDSDDWAHPLKIEQQVLPFFYEKTLQATTSDWIKLADNGHFIVRQGYPFKRKNPASLMFRRVETLKVLSDKSGNLWEQVRTGADSEFFERFKLFFGKECIQHIAKPLTIGGHRHDSLMNDKATGTQNLEARIKRLQYWEDWRVRHIEKIRNHKK